MNRIHRLVGGVLTAVGLLAVTTCGGDGGTEPDGNGNGNGTGLSVAVSGPGEVTIAGTAQLSATVTAGGQPVDTTVTWSSSSTGIAGVDAATGLVTGVARGTATITATVSGTTASATQEITVTVASVTATVSADSMFSIGDTVVVTAAAQDANGDPVAGVPFTFTSSDAGVATVDAEGNVVAAGNGGATIAAAVDGRSAEVQIGVRQVAASVSVSPGAADIFASQTQQFTGTVLDARGNAIAGADVTWGSDNEAVATVDAAGLATGTGEGTATLTATSVEGGFTDTGTLTVTEPTLSAHVQPIFTNTCALSGCHASTNPEEGMSLAAGETHANTVNVPSVQLASMDRIEPGQPDNSYLVHKIQGTQASVGGSGVQMPEGGAPLSQEQIDLIRAWVARGALDN